MGGSLWSWLRKVLASLRPSPPPFIPQPPIAFDAQGPGSSGGGSNRVTISWPQAISRNCCLVVGVRWSQTGGSGAAPRRVVTWGTKHVESMGVQAIDSADVTATDGTYLEFFALGSPPDGRETVSVTISRTGMLSVEGCSVSYSGVNSWGVRQGIVDNTAGNGLSQFIDTATGTMAVHMFAAAPGAIVTISYRTVRYAGVANNVGFVLGDAPGDSYPVGFIGGRAVPGSHSAGLVLQLLNYS